MKQVGTDTVLRGQRRARDSVRRPAGLRCPDSVMRRRHWASTCSQVRKNAAQTASYPRGERPRGKEQRRMPVTPNDCVDSPDLVAAARNVIRTEGGYVVSIGQLLEELEELNGEDSNRWPVSPEMYKLVGLIEALWADPHIDQVPNTGAIEFA